MNERVKQAEKNTGQRGGITTEQAEKNEPLYAIALRTTASAPEHKSGERRRSNEILREASAYFAQAALDRPLKR